MTDEVKIESNNEQAKQDLLDSKMGEALRDNGFDTNGSASEILLSVLVKDKQNAISKEPKPPTFAEPECAKLFSEWIKKYPEEVSEAFLKFGDEYSDFVLQLFSSEGDIIYSLPIAYGNNNTNDFILQNLSGSVLPHLLDFTFRNLVFKSSSVVVKDESGVPIIGQKSEELQKLIDFINVFFESHSREAIFSYHFLVKNDPVFWDWIEQNCSIDQAFYSNSSLE